MLAKKTSKNQITLPKAIASQFPGVDYFEIESNNDSIVLKPLRPSRSTEVRRQLARLRITKDDVTDAIDWARR